MVKKILIGAGIIIFLVIAYAMYGFFYATRQHSPAEEIIFNKGNTEITLRYSRPYKKGRVIFGPGEEALQPFGEYWRLGANQATKFTVNQPVTIMGNKLEPGTYAVYAFPAETTWTIGFNGQWDRWGATPPDYEEDIFRVEINQNSLPQPVEQLTIRFVDDSSVNMVVTWDKVELKIPIDLEG